MEQKKIFATIDQILDNWDPTGVLKEYQPIPYDESAKGEYHMFIRPLISIFLSNQSVYDYLVRLHTELRDYPNKEINEEIKIVSKKIIDFLSKCSLEDLKRCLSE